MAAPSTCPRGSDVTGPAPNVVTVRLSTRQALLFRELEGNVRQAQLALNVFVTALFSAQDAEQRLGNVTLERDGDDWMLCGVPTP